MRRTILHLALAGLALILRVATAFAEPPTKLHGIPFGGGYTDFQVLGPVSQSDIWLLANTDYVSETGVRTARCELFSTDGTVAGTRKLVDLVAEGTCGPISKSRIFDGSRFYFGMERKLTAGISEGNELQIVSTAEASQKVIFPGAPSSFPDNFIQFKGRIYFAATNLSNGREIWGSAGTPGTTILWNDLIFGSRSSDPSNFTVFRDQLYFSAETSQSGRELWSYDPGSGTPWMIDITPGTIGSNPNNLFTFEGLLFFSADVSGQNLYATTGYASGTGIFKDIIGLNSTNPRDFSVPEKQSSSSPKMYFLADTLDSNGKLSHAIWRSDGTAAGTTSIATVSGYPKYIGSLSGSETFVFQHSRSTGGPLCELRSASRVENFPCYYPTIVNGTLYFSEYASSNYRMMRYDLTVAPKKETVSEDIKFSGVVGIVSNRFIAKESGDLSYYSITDRECPSTSGTKKQPGQCGCTVPDTDSDGDGTADCKDGCPTDRLKTSGGVCGCGQSDSDGDRDGVADCIDRCPNDPTKHQAPGVCGCGQSEVDTDRDGSPDCKDECDSDPLKVTAGTCGCGVADTDGDGDRIADCLDGCALDPLKTKPGTCGCGVADRDTDGDKTFDCFDGCPSDGRKTAPGSCGCGTADTDSDSDGEPDCLDQCKLDPRKKTPGLCGCNVADFDTDKDGSPDCKEECQFDSSKQTPGVCGCGVPDVDTDSDGVIDCRDGCVGDAHKSTPGACGCGKGDTDSDNDGSPDCVDVCPSDPNKSASTVCACGVQDTDSDGDGLPDCVDYCPSDPGKEYGGVCGCGVPDADSDNDGSMDCQDGCPTDASKKGGGWCGCGVPDVYSDGDRFPDCLDGCPLDPAKTEPGTCGCGIPDKDSNRDGVVDCAQAELAKRQPSPPVIAFSGDSVLVQLSSTIAGKNQVNTVSYRFKTSIKGRERWSKVSTKNTKSTSLKLKLPKGTVGVEARYYMTILGKRSPASETSYGERR